MPFGTGYTNSELPYGSINIPLDFPSRLNKYGFVSRACYEVIFNLGDDEFEAGEDLSFFATTISLPRITTHNATIHHDGIAINIPFNYDMGHSIDMTILNDPNGIFYSTMLNKVLGVRGRSMINGDSSNGVDADNNSKRLNAKCKDTITIYQLSRNPSWKGMRIVAEGIQITDIGNLDYATEGEDISTFDVTFYATNIRYNTVA